MGLLDKLFGRKKDAEPEASEAAVATECPHTALVPRWDQAEDMGKDDRISRYVCEACQREFSSEEGARILAEEESRLKALEGTRPE